MDPRPEIRVVTITARVQIINTDSHSFEGVLSDVSQHNHRKKRLYCSNSQLMYGTHTHFMEHRTEHVAERTWTQEDSFGIQLDQSVSRT